MYERIISAHSLPFYISIKQMWPDTIKLENLIPRVKTLNQRTRQVQLEIGSHSPPAFVIPAFVAQPEVSPLLFHAAKRTFLQRDITAAACYSLHVQALPADVWTQCKHHFWENCMFVVPGHATPETITLYLTRTLYLPHHTRAWEAATQNEQLLQMARYGRFKIVINGVGVDTQNGEFEAIANSVAPFEFFVRST